MVKHLENATPEKCSLPVLIALQKMVSYARSEPLSHLIIYTVIIYMLGERAVSMSNCTHSPCQWQLKVKDKESTTFLRQLASFRPAMSSYGKRKR